MPQASINGPVMYNCYCSTLANVIPNSISISGFADDHALMDSFRSSISDNNLELRCMNGLELWLIDVSTWMNQTRLKMNPAKMEFIKFGGRPLLRTCTIFMLNVLGDNIESVTVIRYLGSWPDNHLTFSTHVCMKTKPAIANIYKLMHIRRYIKQETCEIFACSLVLCHMDHANGILPELPESVPSKRSKFSSVTKALFDLHWIPIAYRIKFKVLMLVHTCLKGHAPQYLSNLICVYQNKNNIRNSSRKLIVPSVHNKTFTARSYSVLGPKWWNGLPEKISDELNIDNFKILLKTYLFQQAYNLNSNYVYYWYLAPKWPKT